MMTSLSLAGFFDVGRGAYKSVSFTSAQSPFTLTNKVWRIENLALTRPEGRLQGTYTSLPEKKEFHWNFRSTIDPRAFRSFFDTNAAKVFDLFELTVPPTVEGEVWGNWRQPERTGVNARMHAFDFKFRNESFDEVSGTLLYTNQFLAVINPQVKRAVVEKGEAPGIGVDFDLKRVWFTNAFGNLNPQVVARCINRQTGRIMADYIFDEAPTARLNGSVEFAKGVTRTICTSRSREARSGGRIFASNKSPGTLTGLGARWCLRTCKDSCTAAVRRDMRTSRSHAKEAPIFPSGCRWPKSIFTH
jgi:hypothetical protein